MLLHICSFTYNIAKARGIITADERVVTTNKKNPLKAIVDEVMKDSEIKKLVKYVFVAKRTSLQVEMFTHDVDLDNVSAKDVATRKMDILHCQVCTIHVCDHN